jgi:hypothetical protein
MWHGHGELLTSISSFCPLLYSSLLLLLLLLLLYVDRKAAGVEEKKKPLVETKTAATPPTASTPATGDATAAPVAPSPPVASPAIAPTSGIIHIINCLKNVADNWHGMALMEWCE